MKKIFFWKEHRKGGAPFWQPWGCMGCLGRLLLFFLLLAALLLLLSLFKKCSSSQLGNMPVAELPIWKRPIDGGEKIGLPSPEENQLPPFDETTPVPNPDNEGATEIYPNLLYVIFDSEADDETFRTFASKFSSLYPAPDYEIVYYNTGSKTAALSVPEEQRDIVCQQLSDKIPEVDFYVVPVEVMTSSAAAITPNDPAFKDANKSWYFAPIQAQEAWSITQGSSDIIVGIVDSYMDLNHPELKGNRCLYPYSVINDDSDVSPKAGASEVSAGHGTFVTSVAVGNMDNNAGSSGIAPKCMFIPVSLGDNINTITMVEGLLYCMYHGASVINLSCGTEFRDVSTWPLEKQIAFAESYGKRQEKMWDYIYNLAEKRNVTIVWAAGNDNCYTGMDITKRNANTIRVSAVNRQLKKADFSNFGNFPSASIYDSTISAPGVDIWGALPNNSYDAWPGTSFSAPIITGVVALLKSQNKDLTTQQIIKILQSTGKPVAGAPEIGNLVQIKDALLKARKTVASGRID